MPARCLIRLYQKYNSFCQKDRLGDVFYLKPLSTPHPDQWYSKSPIGHNMLSHVVAQLCCLAGIKGHKTNHSLRAMTATRLYQERVDEQLMENTGHHTVQGVRSDKRTSLEQKKAISELLCGGSMVTFSTVLATTPNAINIESQVQGHKGFAFF